MSTEDYIKDLVSEISDNGCLIPTDLLTHNLQNLVDFAKAEQVIEETKRWSDALAKEIEPKNIILDEPKKKFRVVQKGILTTNENAYGDGAADLPN